MLADDARLAQRRQPVVDGHEIDARIAGAPLHDLPTLVVADKRDERRLAAQRDDVGGGIRRATEDLPRRVHLQHRHRRFRRDAAAVSEEIFVENRVADDQYTPVPEVGDHLGEWIALPV